MDEPNPVVQPKQEESPEDTRHNTTGNISIPQVIEQEQPQSSGQSHWTKKISEWWFKLKKFGKECRRVMKVTQKPNREEFLTIAKVSALGMAIIGMIGFILSMIQQLIL